MAVGAKTGGRRKGTPNKRKASERAAMKAAGEMPLDYMLRVMRDPTVDHERRDRMSGQAAPYVHSRLTSLTPPTEGSGTLTITWKNGA